jgi:HPt (histidine-containing phosphotransfer) domain-containing protein
MTAHRYLSMSKAIAYLGDVQSAHQLLSTLNSTLLRDEPEISSAIASSQFDVLQKIWHQLKGFAPVFCQESLIEQIQAPEERLAALHASATLQTSLRALQAEVAAQMLAAAATTKPPSP